MLCVGCTEGWTEGWVVVVGGIWVGFVGYGIDAAVAVPVGIFVAAAAVVVVDMYVSMKR